MRTHGVQSTDGFACDVHVRFVNACFFVQRRVFGDDLEDLTTGDPIAAQNGLLQRPVWLPVGTVAKRFDMRLVHNV